MTNCNGKTVPTTILKLQREKIIAIVINCNEKNRSYYHPEVATEKNRCNCDKLQRKNHSYYQPEVATKEKSLQLYPSNEHIMVAKNDINDCNENIMGALIKIPTTRLLPDLC